MDISRFNAEHIIDRFLRNMIYALRKKEKISISGFGVFETVNYNQKSVINPRTKEKIVVPEYRKVRFKPSDILLESINQK